MGFAIVIFILFGLKEVMRNTSRRSDKSNLVQRVQKTLVAHQMINKGDGVLVGVSGGPDSMALLCVLSRLASDLDFHLGVAHLNHCLRGAEGERDADLVCSFARQLGIPFHIGSAHVLKVKKKLKLSLEDAARRVRYAFFKKIMRTEGYDRLAVGHQMNDNAEQVMLALLRGAGPRGLSGIAPVRGEGVIRPLLYASRTDIEAFLDKEGIVTVEDTSNDNPQFLRNRIRHQLLPLLAAEYNGRISEHLNRLAEITRTDEAWLEDVVSNAYEEVKRDAPKGCIHLSNDALLLMPTALRRRLVRKALAKLKGNLRRISFAHVEAATDLIMGKKGEKTSHLPNGIRVLRYQNLLILEQAVDKPRTPGKSHKKKLPAATIIPYPLPAAIEILEMGVGLRFTFHRVDQLPDWDTVDSTEIYLDLETISFPFILRPTRPGDRFTPLGAGGSQKLKKYFIDHRIPRKIRSVTPVLTDQHRIVWLAGQRMDDHYKITRATTSVLGIEFFLLDM